jgi:hypothetical protein
VTVVLKKEAQSALPGRFAALRALRKFSYTATIRRDVSCNATLPRRQLFFAQSLATSCTGFAATSKGSRSRKILEVIFPRNWLILKTFVGAFRFNEVHLETGAEL